MSIVSKIFFFFEINLNHRVFEKFQRLLPLRQGEFCQKKTATTTLFDIQTVGILREKGEKR